jgi:hypothetical protein
MEKQYYIASGKDYLGPFTLSQIKDKELTQKTLIWYEGLAQWTKAEELEELKVAIPVIVSPPLTPTQVEVVEKQVKKLLLMKLLGKSAKSAGIVFLVVFVIYTIVLYVMLSNQETRTSYRVYATDDEVFTLTITSALIMTALIFLVALPIFYFIENQKPYSNLLTCKDKKEEKIYQGIIKKQEDKYVYDKELSSAPFVIGCIILVLNLIFGFFPEFSEYKTPDVNDIYFKVAFVIRIIMMIYIAKLISDKNRTNWWFLLAIFPAIALMIIGSLYPIREKDADGNMIDKGKRCSETEAS